MSPKFGINQATLTEQRRNDKRLDLILVFELMTGAGEAACQRGDCHSQCTCGCYHTSADLWWQQRWLVIFNCFPPLSGSSYLSEACLQWIPSVLRNVKMICKYTTDLHSCETTISPACIEKRKREIKALHLLMVKSHMLPSTRKSSVL